MSDTILEVKSLSCKGQDGNVIISEVNFAVRENDVVIIQGKSGSGKSTLLKCLAHLNLYDGEVFYHGETPKKLGIPLFRTRVTYVPQRPSLLPGTPRDFIRAISGFSARTGSGIKKDVLYNEIAERSTGIGKAWDVEEGLWDREWSNLSGGEAQRIALATAFGCDTAEVLLLDEPTSALDAESGSQVEKFIVDEVRNSESALKAVVWITHSDEQGGRVGTRYLRISEGLCDEEAAPDV
ncbi:hypothetical protein HGRIS_013045 [Hohenbuehelia grisea]|uniref:ABC transporter domain-containing protein n=1 Tax=Hohenbuehelia grisea TaxID=104357 RepID=A0ABR3IU61_9AGAR